MPQKISGEEVDRRTEGTTITTIMVARAEVVNTVVAITALEGADGKGNLMDVSDQDGGFLSQVHGHDDFMYYPYE